VTGRPQLSFVRHCLLTLSFVAGLGAGFARASRTQHARADMARRLHP
jgi:hypothetical protein